MEIQDSPTVDRSESLAPEDPDMGFTFPGAEDYGPGELYPLLNLGEFDALLARVRAGDVSTFPATSTECPYSEQDRGDVLAWIWYPEGTCLDGLCLHERISDDPKALDLDRRISEFTARVRAEMARGMVAGFCMYPDGHPYIVTGPGPFPEVIMRKRTAAEELARIAKSN